MATKKPASRSRRTTTSQNPQTAVVKNSGFSEAILGFNPGSLGDQLSQVDTIFRSNRWYLLSNMRQVLSEVYVEHGLIQTIVNVPVDDGMRGGVDFKSKQLGPENCDELKTYFERTDILNSSVGMAAKWNRLFGGAAVIIMTDQDPATPLDMAAIGPDSPLEFRPVDMWELFYAQQNLSDYSSAISDGFNNPNIEFYTYYGVKIHKSRVLRMKGLTAPSFVRPRLRGWGFSVVESLVRSLNQYLKSNSLAFEVLDEFKIDVYGFKNLTQTLLSADGTNLVRQRVQLANQQKNYQHAVVTDAEDTYNQKQLSFSGLAETMKEIRIQVASDLRMPLTKIFGVSSAGFNSGEDDIENYNAMVESEVRAKTKYDILRIAELCCQKLFGFIPDDLSFEFKPLRIMSSEQEENVKTQKFNRALAARTAGEISAKEFRDTCNAGKLLDVQLETDDSTLLELESEQDEQGDEEQDTAEGGGAPPSRLEAKKPKEAKA